LIQSNQKSSQQECFFAAHGLSRTKQKKPWAAIFLLHCVRAMASASVKSCYALPTALPCRFFLLSPEAVLLTEEALRFVISICCAFDDGGKPVV